MLFGFEALNEDGGRGINQPDRSANLARYFSLWVSRQLSSIAAKSSFNMDEPTSLVPSFLITDEC